MRDELAYHVCDRCKRYYTRHWSHDYCTTCLATHPAWMPNAGCSDLNCDLTHDEATA